MTDNGKLMTYEEWAKTNTGAKDKVLKRAIEATGHADCLVASGRPNRAAANLEVRQEYYYFEGLNGWAEYDFPKPADADCIAVHIKLTTADPRPVTIMVDGTPASSQTDPTLGTRMNPHMLDEFQSGTFGPEGLRWVSLGVLDCPGGRTSVKLKIVPVGYAPHIAALAVLPMAPYEPTFSPPGEEDLSDWPLPGGSWKQSARNYKINDDGKLVAELRDRRGHWHKRTVDFHAGDKFDNHDGIFKIRGFGRDSPFGNDDTEFYTPPGGSWIQSARNYKVHDDEKLVAELRDTRGKWHQRTVDFRYGDEFDNKNGNFSLRKIGSAGKIARVYGVYEILPELDFGGKFDVMNMKADNLDKVCEECEKRNCNVFVVAGGRAYLKRVMIANGRPVQSPNRSKTCTMYVHKKDASAIKGGPELWYWSSKNTNRRKNGGTKRTVGRRENAASVGAGFATGPAFIPGVSVTSSGISVNLGPQLFAATQAGAFDAGRK